MFPSLARTRTLLLSLLFLFLSFIQTTHATPPSWGQCSCPVSSQPEAGNAKYSTIVNASLCVSASGEQPKCRIEVHCLNDGSGPDCTHRASPSWTVNDLIAALPSLTESTFSTHDVLYRALLNKISTNTKNPDWLNECFHRFQDQSTNGVPSVFQSWPSSSKSATCVYTESGWLHILLHESERKPIVPNVFAVAYQFAPVQ